MLPPNHYQQSQDKKEFPFSEKQLKHTIRLAIPMLDF
tara:strand:- start:322 stop:432 length:111 start_codon:yes stop_codon:yes gene_type:complete